jgi:glycosyltransferase involved in cell wall biosynthesis
MVEPEATGPRELLTEWPEAVATLGIGIAPLTDTKFNSAKSWLKPLEYSALGVPWVASPRTEYARLHALGAGLLANKPRNWATQLRALINSAALRDDLSQRGREIAAQLTIEKNAWQYAEAWENAYKTV